MLKLFWCPQTRASRALWLIEELGLEYELVHINVRDEKSKTHPEFMVASPMGKVPAVLDGDVGLADSAAIGLYLADKHLDKGLAPALDSPKRAHYAYWMTFTPGVIEPAMAEKFSGMEPNKLSYGWGDFPTMISVLERGLAQGPWLLGDMFTAADVMVGASANFLKMFNILPESPVIEGYIERCLARPAYQKALAKDAEFAEKK